MKINIIANKESKQFSTNITFILISVALSCNQTNLELLVNNSEVVLGLQLQKPKVRVSNVTIYIYSLFSPKARHLQCLFTYASSSISNIILIFFIIS